MTHLSPLSPMTHYLPVICKSTGSYPDTKLHSLVAFEGSVPAREQDGRTLFRNEKRYLIRIKKPGYARLPHLSFFSWLPLPSNLQANILELSKGGRFAVLFAKTHSISKRPIDFSDFQDEAFDRAYALINVNGLYHRLTTPSVDLNSYIFNAPFQAQVNRLPIVSSE